VIKAEMNDHIKEVIRERIFDEWTSEFFKGGTRILF
jgi:hypothetical protein